MQGFGGMRKSALFLLLAVFLTLFSGAANAVTIQGVCTDGEKIGVPGVTVIALAGNGRTRACVTDAQGHYRFDALPAGRYTLTWELVGYGKTSRSVVTPATGLVTVDVGLPLTAVMESITVACTGPFVTGLHPPAEHRFRTTKEDPVTTFSIDVDHASYTNVRRQLRAGQAPSADSVRVEEMINYFTYHYAEPDAGKPFAVSAEVTGCPWNAGHRLLRIGLQARNTEQWKLAPNNLVFLVDVSGSMDAPTSLPLIQSALRLLVGQLRGDDRVALVVYAGEAGLVLPPTSGHDKDLILAAIDKLAAGGSTNGGEGIELAYRTAKSAFLPGGNNRVILCTDGEFNVGASTFEQLLALIEKQRDRNIYLTAIGVGTDDEGDRTMELLADKGNGNYYLLDTPAEAEKVFQRDLAGTLVTVADDVKIQPAFDPEAVASYRQIGYENRALENKDFDDDVKDAGELGSGTSVTALYEIEPRRSSGAVASLKIRYKMPGAWRSSLVTTSIVDEGRSFQEATPDTQLAAAVAEFGMLLRDSKFKGTATWADVAAMLRAAQGDEAEELRALLAKAAVIPSTARDLQ
jgi:Ca-activated chloride channel family protein